ncbi:response regulator [Corticibacterium sp. UT-5YL-CI-8]|nr:response regulator [Tianweitania sp. UT-5YL-CI-8]
MVQGSSLDNRRTEQRGSAVQKRQRLVPPPSAPELPKRGDDWLFAGLAALVILAGVSSFLGANFLITAALLAAGLAGIGLLRRALRERDRATDELGDAAMRSRLEIVTLADRMWEMQESEERFHGLIDALGDIHVHRDGQGRILYANSIIADLIGADAEEMKGKTLADFGVDVGLVPEAAFANGECLSSTDVAIHTSDGLRWFSWMELSVRDSETRRTSHRAIAREITARKRAETAMIRAREKAEFANQAKSRFLAMVSHEVRTPMNGIMGMATLLADTPLTPEQRTYVGAVSTSASALLALIEDLLDYSKIEAGRFDPEPQPMSSRELAESVVELLASRAFGKNIGLGCYVSTDVPQIITADPGRVRQVLLNLIGNAIKFTETGGVLVSVTRAGKPGAETIRFAVADTGPGLREQDMERIFEEFEQADGTSTRLHGGAGLGLAISKRIIASLGGTVGVTSTLGKGSEFAFEIPALHPGGSPLMRGEILSGRRAVIVSANTVEAEAMARTLRAHAAEVRMAPTTAQALLMARDADVVLVDTVIEGADGAVLKKMREAGFTGDAITLITPTDRGLLNEYRANGYGNFLPRPVRGETLLRIVLMRQTEQFVAANAVRQSRLPEIRQRREGSALSILVAEDNEINAMLARATLVKAGHSVDVVGNGQAAVDAICSPDGHHYDVVLMDLHMPIMDGLDAITVIRRYEEEEGLEPMPILVLSADSQEKTRHSVIAHGASGFVTKPLDPATLADAVEQQARR